MRSYVVDSELAEAFSRASVFAFLSEYEGFGLPPLEALAAGIPPVLLDTPVAREVCGEAARFVAPGDLAATAAALVDLLSRDEARREVLAAAPAVLARYAWPVTARRTMEALEAAGAGRHA
jgi:alpha-1,3-rhamnosyl/mannosyltransferase